MRISDWSSDVCSSDLGIVAEPLVAARRPDERAVDPAFEPFDMAVGPGERERADEMRVAAGVGAGVAQPGFDAAHRFVEIAPGLGFGPARREDAGLTVERVEIGRAHV